MKIGDIGRLLIALGELLEVDGIEYKDEEEILALFSKSVKHNYCEYVLEEYYKANE